MWWVFWTVALMVLGALAWASISVARLEQRNEANRRLTQRQEVIRLALWRLDSQLAPIIATEAARPLGETGGMAESRRDRAETLSGALSFNRFADGYFTVLPDDTVTASNTRARAAGQGWAMADRASPADAPGAAPQADEPPESEQEPSAFDYQVRQQIANIAQQQAPMTKQSDAPLAAVTAAESAPESARELVTRDAQTGAADPGTPSETAFTLSDGRVDPGRSVPRVNTISPSTNADDGTVHRLGVGLVAGVGQLEPRWVETDPDRTDLVLVRAVADPAGAKTEGVRLDWDALKETLESSLGDLLPQASIVPARGPAAAQLERDGLGFRLATVPALLLPGPELPGAPTGMTPALLALVITWLATLGALVAVGLVLRATLRLSDRRARFVGAVTHELRTPLTTFRLYAQMLAGGMVTDDKARAEYLGTLERESIRLAEIVENVLEYARLTRRRPGSARPPGERPITHSELLARVRPVLSRRAEQSGMDLIVSTAPGAEAASSRTVTCDPRSVERILMNLVENACKYAVPADADAEDADTRIHLDVTLTDRQLEVLVADHGRGIPRRDRERVFGEFQRGPGAAESSRPGLGLGLALSRGLAREMGGDLRLVRRRSHGAEFLLTIPLDPPPAGVA
tara:strand:+ start:8133 stop:10034 length:1902 start_codon:yes stop_codon:yes gene_type:complete